MTHAIADNLHASLRFLTLALLGLMSGCAGTKVSKEQMAGATVPSAPPQSIAILVKDDSPPPHQIRRVAGHVDDVETAKRELTHDLEQMLVARHLAVAGAGQPADLDLRCTITNVRSGSTVARLLVGYGAGKAVLDTNTTLWAHATPAVELLTFTTHGTTGAMPGAGIGVMSATGAAGTAVHMIGPLLGVPGTLKQGLAQEAQQTTVRIDEEMAKIFAKLGWPYIRPSESPPNHP